MSFENQNAGKSVTEAMTKLCPIMSNDGNEVKCCGDMCMWWVQPVYGENINGFLVNHDDGGCTAPHIDKFLRSIKCVISNCYEHGGLDLVLYKDGDSKGEKCSVEWRNMFRWIK